MDTSRNPFRKPDATRWFVLIGFLAVTLLCSGSVYTWFQHEQGGNFFFTFNPADLDLDGDLDILVHNMREAAEFEAYSGGTLWINQGGMQDGHIGQFVYHRSDIEGGRDSALADLDGDGDPDMLVYDGFRLFVGVNQGGEQDGQPGVFRKLSLISPPGTQIEKYGLSSQYGSLIMGDIDNNGWIDALVLGCCKSAYPMQDGVYPPNLSWVWFNGEVDGVRIAGRVASLPALDGLPVAETALGDLDDDGDLDLLAVTLQPGQKSEPAPGGLVLLNDGNGSFRDSGQHLEGTNSSSVALGDLDGDSDLDAVIGTKNGATIWINQGGSQAGQPGIFSASDHALTGHRTHSVILADLDGDRDLDALVAGKRRATLWWNDGQGRFTQADQDFPISDRQDLTTGDFNNDGLEDIFIAEYDKSSQVWFNDGTGSFQTDIR